MFKPAPAAGAITSASPARESEIRAIALARSSGVDDMVDDSGDPKLPPSVPAGYTYFAQLVIHDLTHSVAIGGRAGTSPALRNLATPNLDLDTIYGDGPERCPHLYQPPRPIATQVVPDDGPYMFHLGRTARPALPENWREGSGLPFDLPRIDTNANAREPGYRGGVTPLVQDDRNDDNLILAQLTAQFLLIHNIVASCLRRNGDPLRGGKLDNAEAFALARHFMLKAYRRVVLHDLLSRLLHPNTYRELMEGKISAYSRLPVEFLFGAARVGHAMVRNVYTINRLIDIEVSSLGRLMSFSGHSPNANLPLPADWVIDWRNLLEIEGADIKPQNARPISPFLAPTFVHGELRGRSTGLQGSLSFHDLWRCYQYDVLTGQECAKQAAKPDWPPVLSGEAMLPPEPFRELHRADTLISALQACTGFLDRTPLSYYLLQEAAAYGFNGRRLGPLGSEILAKTILFALTTPPNSLTDHGGLDFADLLSKSGISTLPKLLAVQNLNDLQIAETVIETLK